MSLRLRQIGRRAGSLWGCGMLLLLLSPMIVAFCISFTPASFLKFPTTEWSWKWYRLFWSSPQWRNALANSLMVSLATAATSVVAGTGLATLLHGRRFHGRRLLNQVALSPLFVPGVVLGLAELYAVRHYGLWGTRLALIATNSLLGFPIVLLTVGAALEAIDPELVSAARGLGAGPGTAFRRVTLPLIAPVMGLAGLLAFIVSFQELILAIFLCAPETETLPKVIWPNLRYALTPVVAAASGISLVATVVLIGGCWGLFRIAVWRIRGIRSPS